MAKKIKPIDIAFALFIILLSFSTCRSVAILMPEEWNVNVKMLTIIASFVFSQVVFVEAFGPIKIYIEEKILN